MNWEVSYADICRGCMKDEGEMLHMYDDDNLNRKNMHLKLKEFAGIEVRLIYFST